MNDPGRNVPYSVYTHTTGVDGLPLGGFPYVGGRKGTRRGWWVESPTVSPPRSDAH